MIDIFIWLIGALGAVGAILIGRFWGRVEGRHAGKQEAERDALEQTLKRVERGRATLRDGRSNADPAERLRKNDGKW